MLKRGNIVPSFSISKTLFFSLHMSISIWFLFEFPKLFDGEAPTAKNHAVSSNSYLTLSLPALKTLWFYLSVDPTPC
jgi:hypothetical protein